MTDRVKKLKVKKVDGSFTDYISIGADAKDIDMSNGYSVEEAIGSIDVDNDGNIESQLKNINNKIINQGAILNGAAPTWLLKNEYLITISYDTSKRFLAISKNGETWYQAFYLNNDLFFPNSYDFSITYYNDYFYICYDVRDENYNGFSELPKDIFKGGNRIGITKTKDFIQYEKWLVDVNPQYKQVFAPEWFIDDNNIYIVANAATGTDIYTSDDLPRPTFMHHCFLYKMDSNFKTIVQETQILSYTHPVLDPFLYKENNIYYLFIKDENDKTILQFKNSSLNFNSEHLINTLYNYNSGNENIGMEGPSLIKFNNLYFLYADAYSQNHTPKLFLSDSIEKWYNINTCNSQTSMYHWTPYSINTNLLRQQMIEIFNKNGYPLFVENNYERVDYIVPHQESYDIFFALPERNYIFVHGLDNGLTIKSINMSLMPVNSKIKFLSMSAIPRPLIIKNKQYNSTKKIFREFYDTITLNMRDSLEGTSVSPTDLIGNLQTQINNNSIAGCISVDVIADQNKTVNVSFPQSIETKRIQSLIATPFTEVSNLQYDLKYCIDSYTKTGFSIGIRSGKTMSMMIYYLAIIR